MKKTNVFRPSIISQLARRWVVSLSFFVILFFSSSPAQANNIAINPVSVVGWDTEADTAQVEFDLSWENSWRDATNFDAVWVFIKYSTDSGTTWHHAKMAASGTNPAGFNDGSGTSLEIVVPADKKGTFLQRSGNGTGTVTATGVKLVWDYGADGLSDADGYASTTKVKVIAIEMVYIPQASFYVGDTDGGGSSVASFEAGNTNAAFQVTGEGALTLGGTSASNLGNNNGASGNEDFDDSTTKTLPAEFPKGFAAFYLMKYEISQGQYRDFLNTLTTAQKAKRTTTIVATKYVMSNTNTVSYRNGLYTADGSTVVCDFDDDGTGNESNDGAGIAMNYMSWVDLCAYADWAGLRPMTELEFEKAARGPTAAVAGEYAWGTTNITEATSHTNSGLVSEGVGQSGNGLCAYYVTGGLNGPVRVGFAAAGASTRVGAGAGYYGNMELSGNVTERAVTVGNSTGRAFTGTHGDGMLTGTTSYEGNATNTDWPGINATPANGITGASGSGFRGGYWNNVAEFARTSYRSDAAYEDNGRYENFYGGRVGRTAP